MPTAHTDTDRGDRRPDNIPVALSETRPVDLIVSGSVPGNRDGGLGKGGGYADAWPVMDGAGPECRRRASV